MPPLIEDFEAIRQRLQEIESDQMPPIRVSAEDELDFYGSGGLTYVKAVEGYKIISELW